MEHDSETFSNFAAYVMQNDVIFETLTPREAQQFVADLKYTDAEIMQSRVEGTIKTMKLVRCQNVEIGGASLKGISGGKEKELRQDLNQLLIHQVFYQMNLLQDQIHLLNFKLYMNFKYLNMNKIELLYSLFINHLQIYIYFSIELYYLFKENSSTKDLELSQLDTLKELDFLVQIIVIHQVL